MNVQEWETAFKEVEMEYQADLRKYTKEINELKKDNLEKQKQIAKFDKFKESIYPSIMNIKGIIQGIEDNF